jgi:hypothetical protein
MATKDELISHIKQWMQVENTIKALQTELKKHREMKKSLTDKLVDIMKDNEIDCFDVKNGKLIYTQRKAKAALNKKTLLAALEKAFPDDTEKAQQLSEFILETREESIKESIRLREQK